MQSHTSSSSVLPFCAWAAEPKEDGQRREKAEKRQCHCDGAAVSRLTTDRIRAVAPPNAALVTRPHSTHPSDCYRRHGKGKKHGRNNPWPWRWQRRPFDSVLGHRKPFEPGTVDRTVSTTERCTDAPIHRDRCGNLGRDA